MQKIAACLILIICLLVGFEWSNIYVSDNFEKPFRYKLNFIILKSLCRLASFTSQFNDNSNEIKNIRLVLNYLNMLMQIDNTNIELSDVFIKNIPVRVYSARLKNKKPILIYFHGGGYAFGSLDSYDTYLKQIVTKLNLTIVSVNYRLAPEFPYPAAINDCYTVTNYVLANINEFNGDINKILIGGDSAGGNAAAVIAQRLKAENKPLPKLQILIYPRTQMFNFKLPSYTKYENTGMLASIFDNSRKLIAWYLGIKNVTEEILDLINSNQISSLIKDTKIQDRIKNYLDINKIPNEYKNGKSYYDEYEIQKNDYYTFNINLEESHILKKDKNLANLMKKLFSADLSPIMSENLTGLPKTYFIIAEWDTLKDEGLLYAQRLKSAGINVNIGFYEDSFHGMAGFVDPTHGYRVSMQMLDDLIIYIQNNL